MGGKDVSVDELRRAVAAAAADANLKAGLGWCAEVTKRLSDAIARSGKGSKEVYDGLVLDADP